MQEEIFNKYAVSSTLRSGTLPSFYITQADGTRKLIQEGYKEHRLLQSYAADMLENLEPEDIKVVREQIAGFVDLQNDLADLMEKFPGQYKNNPENHPFYKMGLGLFEEFADYILGTEFRIGAVFMLLVFILVYRRFKLSKKREYLK